RAPPYPPHFRGAAGPVPELLMPQPLPAGATGINIYLTQTNGGPGSELFYETNSQGVYNLTAPVPSRATPPLVTLFSPPPVPLVNAMGGGTTGGSLAAGTY